MFNPRLVWKQLLFIGTIHLRSSAAAPQTITTTNTTEKTCTSVPQNDRPFYINADHSQRSQPPITSPRRFTTFNNPQRRDHNSSLSSVPDHQPQPPLTRAPAAAAAAATTPPSTMLSPSPSDQKDLVQQWHHRLFPRTARHKQNHEAPSESASFVRHRRQQRPQVTEARKTRRQKLVSN